MLLGYGSDYSINIIMYRHCIIQNMEADLNSGYVQVGHSD